jgi:hypothetical protein
MIIYVMEIKIHINDMVNFEENHQAIEMRD